MRDDGCDVAPDKGLDTRKPILLAVSIVAAAVILLAVLFVALSIGGPAKGSASTADATPTVPADAPAIAALLPNPGFEDGFTGWERGNMDADGGVTPNLDAYTVDIDHSVAHSGTASARIAFTDTDRLHQPKYYAYISTRIPADIFRGKRVQLSAYMRTVSATVGIELWMKAFGTIDGKPTDPYIPMSWDDTGYGHRDVIGTKDWVNEAMVLDIPPEADYLVFGVRTGNYGLAWVDDIRLEVVGPDVPVTGRVSAKQGENLDFEQGLVGWDPGSGSKGHSEVGTGADMAHSGKLGAYITHSGGTEGTGGLFYPIIYGQYFRDKLVSVSAYVNVDNMLSGATLVAEVYYLDENGKEASPPISNTTRIMPIALDKLGWQKAEVTIPVPDRAWGLTFGIMPNGNGELWVDDFSIDVLGPAPTPIPTHTPR
ncbi:MAG TPA: hypothetical protein VLQ48_02340 [Chloroflexia bacterium]|nr:hypothetical protein [Chloroflexia bacterium]